MLNSGSISHASVEGKKLRQNLVNTLYYIIKFCCVDIVRSEKCIKPILVYVFNNCLCKHVFITRMILNLRVTRSKLQITYMFRLCIPSIKHSLSNSQPYRRALPSCRTPIAGPAVWVLGLRVFEFHFSFKWIDLTSRPDRNPKVKKFNVLGYICFFN